MVVIVDIMLVDRDASVLLPQMPAPTVVVSPPVPTTATRRNLRNEDAGCAWSRPPPNASRTIAGLSRSARWFRIDHAEHGLLAPRRQGLRVLQFRLEPV